MSRTLLRLLWISGAVRLHPGSATVRLASVVVLVSTLWTGLVGDWHGTLAVVKEMVSQGKVFPYFLVEVGLQKQHNQALDMLGHSC